ncbi:MAG: fibronectin type III domain-containing protein, partial [Bacteroidia bacterium]|nr:fibronectin type III domain-containing protein [Bacteroidia bacterium]MDW8159177.1 fibronectin type III domain-containing protein [Bacteroidia bacterium]
MRSKFLSLTLGAIVICLLVLTNFSISVAQTPLCPRIALTAEPTEVVNVPLVLGTPGDSLKNFRGLSFRFIFDIEKLEVPNPSQILQLDNSILGTNGVDFDVEIITTRINNGEIEINIAALGRVFDSKQGIIGFIPLRVKASAPTGSAASVSIERAFFVDNVFDFKNLGTCLPSIINICKKGTFSLRAQGPTTFCEGSSVRLSVEGSLNNSTFQWLKDGRVIAGQNASTLVVTEAGSYRAIITTGNCRDTTAAVNVTVNPLPRATFSVQDDDGSQNGSITLTPEVGASPIRYSLDGTNFQAANTFSNLRAGRYTVTIQDANNCKSTLQVTINLIATCPIARITPSGTIRFCSGGGVELNAPPSNDFSYQWLFNNNPISGAINSIYLARQAGTYRVRISKAGCPDSTSEPVTLVEIPSPDINVTKTDATDTRGGSITITVSGGTSPYQYSIDGGETFTSSPNNIFTFDNLPPGIYSINVKDGNNCSSPRIVIQEIRQVTNCPDPRITPSGPIITRCAGTSVVLRAPKVAGYRYAWLRNNINIPLANLDSLVVNTTGNYRVRISFNGCPDTLSAPVTVNFTPLPTVSTTVVADSGQGTGKITINATGGTPPYLYSINNGPFTSQNTYSNLIFGSYSYAARDNNGCEARGVVIVPRVGAGCPNATVEKDSVNVSVPGGNDGSVWARFNNLPAGTYTVTLEGPNGCRVTTFITVNEGIVTKCETPTNIKLDSLRNNTAYISWGLVPGAIEYRVYYRAVGALNFILISRNTNTVVIPNLQPNTSYEVEIRAHCNNGLFSELSSRFTFTNGTVTPTCNPPSTINFSNITNASVLVSWGAVSNAQSYT